MPSADDYKDDPPRPHVCSKHGDFVPIESRCDTHKDSFGDCYACHLDKYHRPEEDAFYQNMKYNRPDPSVPNDLPKVQ